MNSGYPSLKISYLANAVTVKKALNNILKLNNGVKVTFSQTNVCIIHNRIHLIELF